jgi:RNA polymerase sigma-70 factor (ECF subfamily)
MSVITAVPPPALISDSDYVYTTLPGACRTRPDREHRPRAPAGRRRSAWEDQFAEVVHTRLPRLQRLARRVLHSEDLADDAVQEALLSLWKEGRMPANPEGWLVRAVVLRSLHLNRSRRRRRSYEARAGALRSEHDPCGDAARALEAQEVAHAIAGLLGKLPEHLRAVFVLREAEQYDYEAIAQSLQIPLGTVRSRLNRSRKAIGALLRPLLEEDDPENREKPGRVSRA